MEQIKVKAALGVRVPMENAHRKYINDSDAVKVDATMYYLLRLKEKDLLRVEDEATCEVKPGSATGTEMDVPAAPLVHVPTSDGATEAAATDHIEVQ